MPNSRSLDKSALQAGLAHLALSVAGFGALGATATGAVMVFGDESAAGPRVELALYAGAEGPAPALKGASEPEGHSHDTEEPSLPGVAYVEAEPGGTITITDMDAAGTDVALASAAAPLVKAPLKGYFVDLPAGRMPRIAPDGSTPAQVYARPFTPNGQPRISIIVGGLGLNRNNTLSAIDELPPEVTLSFVPYADNLQTWLDRARAAGHEVMLELPMEPFDYPNVDTGPYTLMTSARTEENMRRLDSLLGKATGYFGVTNYQGAKFATDAKAAGPVMAALKRVGLAFVHDGAAARSALPAAAGDASLPFVAADRILDTDPSADAIDRQLLQLEALALQNGHATGVGLAYPVTVEQFSLWAKSLPSKGYQLAPASAAAGVVARPPGKSS